MPTGAGKQDEDHDHWQARDAVWASWGDQEAYDKKMTETKDRRDAARTVHEAKQEKKTGGVGGCFFNTARNQEAGEGFRTKCEKL